MRIALLNSTDYAGGAETVTRMLRDGLRDRGHDVALWVGRCSGTDNKGSVAIPTSAADRAKARRYAQRGFFSLGLDASLRFCKSTQLDGTELLHLHNLHGHYFSIDVLPVLAQRVPLVWTLHDFFAMTGGCAFPFDCDRWLTHCGSCPQLGHYPLVTAHDRTRRLQSIKRNAFRKMPASIVTPSEHLKRAVLRSEMFAAADVQVIPYGVDTDAFKPDRARARQQLGLHADQPVVLLVAQGLDDPRKGIEHALAAVRRMGNPALTVLVIGAGDTKPMFRDLGGSRVRTYGYVADRLELARCFSAADLMMFTSLSENFPCVVLEAMACGTPVLAFDIDGVNEQIQPGRTGFLVPVENTDELATVAGSLLRNTPKLRQVGEGARRHVLDHWSQERFLDRHEQLYREVLARGGPRRAGQVNSSGQPVLDAP